MAAYEAEVAGMTVEHNMPQIEQDTVFESDWLASDTVFYNDKTGTVSHHINDVIDWSNLEFHPDGLNNYLDFGFSVFEQTPVKNVKFLRHSSRLKRTAGGKISVQYFEDYAAPWEGRTSNESDVVEMLQSSVQRWEESVDGDIVIPTSGGWDSRALNSLIKDKSRIRSFTYGISDTQEDSCEVVYARELSRILKTQWQQIELGSFHRYLDEWNELFGPSTHAHGMYHIEFYRAISSILGGGRPMLSGIIGFWNGVVDGCWAAGGKVAELERPRDLMKIAFTHGKQGDSHYSLLKSTEGILEQYFEANRSKFADPFWIPIEAMRMKMILSAYLLRIPQSLGFTPWSPFIVREIALAMLNIPASRRRDRAWQVDFFRKQGIFLEDMNLESSNPQTTTNNTLNLQAQHKVPVRPLDVNLLREVVDPAYVEWINNNVDYRSSIAENIADGLLQVRGVRRALRGHGFTTSKEKQRRVYRAYLVLFPIEQLLRRRKQL